MDSLQPPRHSSPDGQYDDGHARAGTSDAGSSAAGPSRAGGSGSTAADGAPMSAAQKKQHQEEKARRAYRACTACRSRKARCDLGDLDDPRDPPCARCKREKRECTFLPSRRGGNLAAKAKAKQETTDDDRDAISGIPMPRRTSFASDSAQEGSALKRPKIDSSEGFPGPSSSLGRPGGLQPPPNTSSDVSTWSTSQLDMWSSVLSGVNRSPLPNSSILPNMQTSPSLPFGVNLAAPPFSSSGVPPIASSSSSLPSFVGDSGRPILPSPPKPAINAATQGSSSMPPPADRTSPSFLPQRAEQSSVPYESASSNPLSQQPSTSSAFPPPISSNVLFPAAPSHPPPLRPPPPRRTATTHTTSRPANFITAGMANEADALSLLALTATGEKKGSGRSPGTASEPADTPDGRQSERSLRSEGSSHRRPGSNHAGDGTGAFEAQTRELDERDQDAEAEEVDRIPTPPPLADCDLIRKGALTKRLLVKYVDQFFRRHHQIFPMIPISRMPKTELELQAFAQDEKHLLTAMVIIASRHDAENPLVHEKAWDIMSGYIHNCVVKGRETSVGFVESMLLLSENLPRQEEKDAVVLATDTKTWDDSTQSWFFVGHAVRTGYLLGLDQQTLYIDPSAPTTPQIDRERLAWTYCYLFDRHISLRIGKAFWSRGPGLCFTPNDAHTNFPSLRPIPGAQDDLASVVQALVELTQQMTTAHDVLYPSKDRTLALMRAGEYIKYLSDFERSIQGFEAAWRPKRFDTFPCAEIIWSTHAYLRLYVFAFAFQAHVQRADEQGLSAHSKFGGLFPRGTSQSPDAKFIFESIDAARQLLELATDRLHPGGALPYVPARIFGWISFASSFLLKAVYSGAVAEGDTQDVVELIQKVIFCLANSSPDRQHLGIRHALLLRTVMKQLKTAFHTAEWVSHTGTATPVFPERWHVAASRTNSPERAGASGTAGPPPPVGQTPSGPAPPSPWPASGGGFTNSTPHGGGLPASHFGTPAAFMPDGGGATGNGSGSGGGSGGNSGGIVNLDWLAGFGDLLGDSPVGGLGGNLGGTGFGPGGATGGLGELSFLDMELGSSWWTNVLPPEGNQGR